MNYNIKEIEKLDFEPFFDLMGEVELGSEFNSTNENHRSWLKRKIESHYQRGMSFYALYDENEKPVGFASLLIEKGPSDISYFNQKAELYDIAIFPEHRGKGLGGKLLKYIENIVKKENRYCLYISTYEGDPKAIGFYETNGYSLVATLPDVHGPSDKGIVYLRKVFK